MSGAGLARSAGWSGGGPGEEIRILGIAIEEYITEELPIEHQRKRFWSRLHTTASRNLNSHWSTWKKSLRKSST